MYLYRNSFVPKTQTALQTAWNCNISERFNYYKGQTGQNSVQTQYHNITFTFTFFSAKLKIYSIP